MQYNLTSKDTDGIGSVYNILVSTETVNLEIDSQLNKIAPQVKVAGFRPGKVPLEVMRMKYGKQIKQDAVGSLVQEIGKEIVKKEKINPMGPISVKDVKSNDDGSINVQYSIINTPDINIDSIAEISIKKYSAKPSKDEIKKTLSDVADKSEKTAPVKTARAFKEGDTLMIDFLGKVDGKPFQGGEAKNFALKLGSNAVIPEFEKSIKAMKMATEKTFKVMFPETMPPDIAGKEATFTVTINEHREAVKSKVDTELAKSLGMESVEELEKMIEDSLKHQYDNLSNQLTRRSLLDALDKKFKFKIPKYMLDSEFDSIWAQVMETKKRGELSPNEKNLSEEELKKEYRDIAQRRSSLGVLMSYISSSQKIAVSDKEIEDAIARESHRYGDKAAEFQELAKKNPRARASIENPILEDKVIDWIIKRVQIDENEVSSDKLMQLSQEDDDVKKTKKKKVPTATLR